MSAMTFPTGSDAGVSRSALGKLRAKFGPLTTVVVAHIIAVYFLYSGLLTRMVEVAIPKAVMVEFVALPEIKEPPSAPKTVPVVQMQPPLVPQVPIPLVQIAPSPNAIVAEQAVVPVQKPVEAAPVVAAAPAAPTLGAPKTITSGIEYIVEPRSVYPQMSKRMGEQGKVVLRILVNEKGHPDQVQIQTSSGFARLDEAGRQAGLRAVFKPRLEDGRPVSVYVLIPVNFQLTS